MNAHRARRRAQFAESKRRRRAEERGLVTEPIRGTGHHVHPSEWGRDALLDHLRAFHGRTFTDRKAPLTDFSNLHSVFHEDERGPERTVAA